MQNKVVLLSAMLLLLGAAALAAQGEAEACSVTHYLMSGEQRDFRFGSGPQFRAQLACVFTFAGPTGERLEVQAQEVHLAAGNDSCNQDAVRVFDWKDGELSLEATICGTTNTSTPVHTSANIAVVTFSSHEGDSPRFFMLAVSSSAAAPPPGNTTATTTTTTGAGTTARTTTRPRGRG